MRRDREIKNAKGGYVHLEKPEFGVIIKGGKIVDEEAWKIFTDRQKQDKYVPTQADRERAKKTAEKAENLELEKIRKENKELKNDISEIKNLLKNLKND